MYKYPYQMSMTTGTEEQTENWTFTIDHCVADCPTANFQMVNNPELGRCEFLGYYCKAGNYKEGCLEVYDESKKYTQLMDQQEITTLVLRSEEGLDNTYGTPTLKSPSETPGTFRQSVLTASFTSDGSSSVPNCYSSSNGPNDCDLCKPGYLMVKLSEEDNSAACVQRCPDGFRVSFDSDDQLKVRNQTCVRCDNSCNTCIEDGSCTSCKAGYYLEIFNTILSSGSCVSKIANDSQITLSVHGDRSLLASETDFPSLISALQATYELAARYTGLNITIFLKPDIPHYVTIRDSFESEVALRHMIDPSFSLNILPEGCLINQPCSKYATLFNKAGSRFSIKIPMGAFTMQNIIIDAVDSVIDYVNETTDFEVYTAIIDSTQQLCHYTSRGYITCSITVNGEVIPLQPYFHKSQTCFIRPSSSGLLTLLHSDQTGFRTEPILRSITLQSCTFRNFFHEFNSLVLFPSVTADSNVPLQFSLNFTGNVFTHFSTCGSVLSNNNHFMADNGEAVRDNTMTYGSIYYWAYINDIDQSRSDYYSRFMIQRGSSQSQSQGDSIFEITFQGNSFSNFNFLKDYSTDSDSTTRTPRMIAQVPMVEHQHHGLLIDIRGSFTKGYLEFKGNSISDSLYYYMSKQSVSTERQPTPWTVVNHCESIEQSQDSNMFPLWEAQSDQYAQLAHLISIQDHQEAKIIIVNNHFRNLSMSSSLIYLSEKEEGSDSKVVLQGNNFTLVSAYLGVGVMDLRKIYNQDANSLMALTTEDVKLLTEDHYEAIKEAFKVFARYSGNVLIASNYFAEIVGCPAVHTSLIQVSIMDSYGSYATDTDVARIKKFDVVPQDQSIIVQVLNYLKGGSQVKFMNFLASIYEEETTQTMTIRSNSYTFKNQSVQFRGNTYERISLGVIQSSPQMSEYLRGSLIKFNTLFAVDFQDETFLNIGAFTQEHLSFVIKQIKGEESFLNDKESLKIDSRDMVTPKTLPNGDPAPFFKQSIFTNYLSTSLIDVYCLGRLRFLEQNHFTNIWVFHAESAMVVDLSQQNSSTQKDTGLILYANILFHQLQFGGPLLANSTPKGNIFISNFTGPFNRMNFIRDPFRAWNQTLWKTGDLAIESNLLYGGSSVLFNIQDDSNNPSSITVQNVQFQYMYTRVTEQKQSNQLMFPMIISSLKGSSAANTNSYLDAFVLKNIYMKDVTFEGGSSFFLVYATTMTLSNITAINIGTFRYKQEPEMTGFKDQLFANISTSDFPFFEVYFMGASDSNSANNLTASNLTFINIQQFGGLPIFQIMQISAPTSDIRNQINLTCVTLKNVKSSLAIASLLYDINPNGSTVDVYVKSSTFTQLYSINGLIASLGSLTSVVVRDCTFSKNQGEQAKLFFIFSNNFKYFLMDSCKISNVPQIMSEVMLNVLQEDPSLFNSGKSQFKVQNSKDVFITKTIVSDIHYVDSAAFIDIRDKSEVALTRITVSDLSAYQAGVFSITGASTLQVLNSTFRDNLAVKNGVFSGSDYSTIIITGCTFKGNQAVYQGVFKVSGEASFQVTASSFQANIAEKQNSIGQIIQIAGGSFFKECSFFQNQAYYTAASTGAKGLEVLSCENLLSFTACTFQNNFAKQTTANVYLNRGQQVVFTSCSFIYNYAQVLGSELKGSFLHLIAESSMQVANSSFVGGHAMLGGAVYLLGDASAQISRTKFTGNIAEIRGGAICAESFTTLVVDDACIFDSNEAYNETGDSIYGLSSTHSASILKSSFIHTKASNFLSFKDISQVFINNITVKIPEGATGNKTSGVIIANIKQLSLLNSLFENLISSSESGGGALQITETANSKSATNSFYIGNSVFKRCQNVNGGAVGITDAAHVKINATTFLENRAVKSGGAVYFKCSDYGANLNKCKLTVNNTQFLANRAEIEGGAIKWNFYEPLMKNITSIGNTAGIYGGDIASVPKKLIRIEKSELNVTYFPDFKLRSMQNIRLLEADNALQIDNVQSGGFINIYLALIDKYGSVIKTDNTSKLFISAETQFNSVVSSLLESSTQVNCVDGNFIVENLVFVGEPNTTQKLKFTTDGINSNIPDNALQNTLPLASTYDSVASDFVISLSLRQCLEGEQMLFSGKCQNCTEGTFLLVAPTQTTLCKECVDPEKGECLGGSQLYPLPGYWRSSRYSENMIPCRNDQACLGRNPPQNEPLGACGEGYQGILCTDCQVGYSRSGASYKCSKCPSTQTNVLRMLGLFALLVCGLVLLIRSNLQSATKEKNYMTVFIRILMNHFQLLTLTASFDLQWPTQLQTFFSVTKPVSEVSTQFLSVDCFLDQRRQSLSGTLFDPDSDSIFRIFFQKLLILGFSPFMVVGVSIVVWTCIFSYSDWQSRRSRLTNNNSSCDSARVAIIPDTDSLDTSKSTLVTQTPSRLQSLTLSRQLSFAANVQNVQNVFAQKILKDKKQARIIASIIIVLFLMHPTITSTMFNAFSCQNIDGTDRLFEDLQVICYQQSHKIIAFSVGLPSLVLWGLGIPTYGLILVYKNRKELQKFEVKEKYGFLYNGYRQPQAYFWEFIIMYRKIVIIFIQVFLAQSGKIVQALSTLLFLIVCLSATAVKQPFQNLSLNSLESISLMSSAITVYCGVFYIADAQFKSESDFSMTGSSRVFLFGTIIGSHSLFMAFWGYHFLQEMRTNIRKRLPELYVSLFLCCQQRKLDREMKIEEFRSKISPFLAQYDKALYYLEMRRKIYNSGQIPLEDDLLRPLVLKIARFATKVERNLIYSGNKNRKSVKIHDIIEHNEMQKQSRNLRVDKQGAPLQGRDSAIKKMSRDNLQETVYFGNKWGLPDGGMIPIGDEETNLRASLSRGKSSLDVFNELENEEIKEEFFDEEDLSQFSQVDQEVNNGGYYERKPKLPIKSSFKRIFEKQLTNGRSSMPQLETTFKQLSGIGEFKNKKSRQNSQEKQITDHEEASQHLESNRGLLSIAVDNLQPPSLAQGQDAASFGVHRGLGEAISKGSSRKLTLDDYSGNNEASFQDFQTLPKRPLQSPRATSRQIEGFDSPVSSHDNTMPFSFKELSIQSFTSRATKPYATSGRKLRMLMVRSKRQKRKYFNEQMAKGKISSSRLKKPVLKPLVRQRNNNAIEEDDDNINLDDFSVDSSKPEDTPRRREHDGQDSASPIRIQEEAQPKVLLEIEPEEEPSLNFN